MGRKFGPRSPSSSEKEVKAEEEECDYVLWHHKLNHLNVHAVKGVKVK